MSKKGNRNLHAKRQSRRGVVHQVHSPLLLLLSRYRLTSKFLQRFFTSLNPYERSIENHIACKPSLLSR